MQFHRLVKIAILSVIIFFIIYRGICMYRQLDYNKHVYDVDICSMFPSDASRIVTFNKNGLPGNENGLDGFINQISDQIFYPAIIIYKEDKNVFLAKVNYSQVESIKNILDKELFPGHSPKVKVYKDVRMCIYAGSGDVFLATAFYNGMFMASRDYSLLEEMVDESSSDLYWGKEVDKEFIERFISKTSASVFTKWNEIPVLFEYSKVRHNDSIVTVSGYILSRDKLAVDSLALTETIGECVVEDIKISWQENGYPFWEITLIEPIMIEVDIK